MKMNNMAAYELNDNELDMVTGGGFFDVAKRLAGDLWQAVKDTVEILETSRRIRQEL